MNFGSKNRILIFLLILISQEIAFTQSRTVKSADKKKQQIEQRQKKAYEKARAKSIKDKFDMQSEATQKQIKESHQRAKKYNASDKPPFLKRLFKRRKKPKH